MRDFAPLAFELSKYKCVGGKKNRQKRAMLAYVKEERRKERSCGKRVL